MNSFLQRLKSITSVLLSPELDYTAVRNSCTALYEIFSSVSAFKENAPEVQTHISTASGLAVTGLATPNLYVYPNPNRGQFTIQFYNQANEEVTVRVFDSKGAQVYQRKVLTTIPYTNIQIDLTNGRILTSGVYIVDVLDSGGRQIGTRRIIVYQ